MAGSFLILGVWAYLCVRQGRFVSIPVQDLGLLIALIGGKVGGKFLEVKENLGNGKNETQKARQ